MSQKKYLWNYALSLDSIQSFSFAQSDQNLTGAFWVPKDAKFLRVNNEDADQTAQADLSLCWAHMSRGTFSQVAAQM